MSFRLVTLAVLFSVSTLGATVHPNILFIVVDDLRPELNCYGAEHIQSPNIDRLAKQGMLFERAYCQVPVCGASRASLLSGVRPTKDRFVKFSSRLDQDLPDVPSLPSYFRQNGYETRGIGKIFHSNKDCAESSWDQYWNANQSGGLWRNYVSEENLRLEALDDGIGRGLPYERASVEDDAYFDGQSANKAIEYLRELRNGEAPFFLSVGFVKPHLPFNAPEKYWDIYSEDKIELAENPFKPQGAPDVAMHDYNELRSYYGVPKSGPVPDGLARKLIHGYYACVSYTDAQIGRLLTALDNLGLRDNTIVVVLGDHGWHLGEHGLWCKHCNFEKVMRAPLIISAPDFPDNQVTDRIVEFVDIYPTLVDLAGLPMPLHLQGQSLRPLLRNPKHNWKSYASSRWQSGETIITDSFAFTQWFDQFDEPTDRMLYDLESNPGEILNVAEQPEYIDQVAAMTRLLYEARNKAQLAEEEM